MDPEVLSKSQFYILLEMLRGRILRYYNARYFLFDVATKHFSEKPSSTRTVVSLVRQGFIAGDPHAERNRICLTDAGREKIEHESSAGVFR